jgi:hypothetical protein
VRIIQDDTSREFVSGQSTGGVRARETPQLAREAVAVVVLKPTPAWENPVAGQVRAGLR